jgi:hypothetical protein
VCVGALFCLVVAIKIKFNYDLILPKIPNLSERLKATSGV